MQSGRTPPADETSPNRNPGGCLAARPSPDTTQPGTGKGTRAQREARQLLPARERARPDCCSMNVPYEQQAISNARGRCLGERDSPQPNEPGESAQISSEKAVTLQPLPEQGLLGR